MKSKLKIIILVAAMAAAATAHAAERIGYFIDGTQTIGGNAQTDTMLTSSDIDTALLDGIRAAGISLDLSKTGGKHVLFDFMTSYAPNVSNLRVISGLVALREDVTVRGKSRSVVICSRNIQSWSYGPNEQGAVKTLLEAVRQHGSAFVTICMK